MSADLRALITAKAQERTEAYAKKQALQARQREQLNAAREAGLRARHASKEHQP